MAAGIQVAVDTRFAEQAEPGAKTQRSLQGSVKDNLFLSLRWQSKQCLVPETMNILGRASSAWCRTKESLVWGDVINLFIVGLYDCLFALALIRLIDIRHGFVLLFTLVSSLGFELGLSVLVKLELGNYKCGSGNANRNGGSVDLFSGDSLDVDNPLFAVDSRDFSFTCLVHSSRNQYLIVLSDGHRSDSVSGLEFLREVGAHELSSGLTVGTEVGLAGFTAAGRNVRIELHLEYI